MSSFIRSSFKPDFSFLIGVKKLLPCHAALNWVIFHYFVSAKFRPYLINPSKVVIVKKKLFLS